MDNQNSGQEGAFVGLVLKDGRIAMDLFKVKTVAQYMLDDPRATFSKADAVLKSSEQYLAYKNIVSLKQCAMRGLVSSGSTYSICSKLEPRTKAIRRLENVHD